MAPASALLFVHGHGKWLPGLTNSNQLLWFGTLAHCPCCTAAPFALLPFAMSTHKEEATDSMTHQVWPFTCGPMWKTNRSFDGTLR